MVPTAASDEYLPHLLSNKFMYTTDKIISLIATQPHKFRSNQAILLMVVWFIPCSPVENTLPAEMGLVIINSHLSQVWGYLFL